LAVPDAGTMHLLQVVAGNHGICIHHLGLDVCLDEDIVMYHNSLQVHLVGGSGHCIFAITLILNQ